MPRAILATALAALATAPTALAEPRTARELERDLGPGVEVSKQRETGALGFVGTAPGRSISPGASGGARARALAFAASLASELGLGDPARELDPIAVVRLGAGRSAVRLRQLHDGLPVIGGELIVNLDRSGDVVSLSGETVPRPRIVTEPALPRSEADGPAVASVAREHRVEPASLRASPGELSVFDSRLLGGPGLGVPQLVWRFEVTSDERPDIRQFALVDAARGAVVVSFNQVPTALDREVCDAANTTTQVPCTSPVVSEGGTPPADTFIVGTPGDVEAAYKFAGDTHAFYTSEHGRDSLDGAGMTLVSTADYCASLTSCPMANAFWNGEQMAYGDGYAGADDVVAHELTHGVTEFSSNLFYYYQSGAINEAFSDIWGEFVDLGNGLGNDVADVRWLLGEDLPGGAIRDMAHPTTMGDPDRMGSGAYFGGESDNGGVHTNSGVANKAAYLIADGDAFNGKTVTGIGIPKTAEIFYRAQTALLTSAGDYLDLYNALNQACTDLIGGPDGITASDCAEVRDATDAVEMNLNPSAAPTVTAVTCTTGGETPVTAHFDSFVSGTGFVKQVISGSDLWSYPGSVDYSGDGGLADAFDAPGNGFSGHDSALAMTTNVTVPVGGFMRFTHAYGFDDDPSGAYGGGVVEYSLSGGATWLDLGPRFEAPFDGDGGYDDVERIATGAGVPPGMADRRAFVRESNGYGASRADIAQLAGQPIRLRFRVGADAHDSFFDQGWFIDDLRIYGCAPQTGIVAGPANGATVTEDHVNLTVSNSSATSSSFQCAVDAGGFGACPGPVPQASQRTVGFDDLADGSHTLRVRALGARGTPDPTPATRAVTIDTSVLDPLLRGRRVQRVRPNRVVAKVKVGAGEAVTVKPKATVRLGRQKLRLVAGALDLAAGERETAKLKPRDRGTARRLARALRRGRRLRTTAKAIFTDAHSHRDKLTRELVLRKR